MRHTIISFSSVLVLAATLTSCAGYDQNSSPPTAPAGIGSNTSTPRGDVSLDPPAPSPTPPPAESPGADANELKGTVAAVLSRSCGTNSVTFTVTANAVSTTVRTSTSTVFEGATCATLAVNQVVEVKGTRQTDNSLLASNVDNEQEPEGQVEPPDHEGNEADLSGIVSGAAAGHGCPAFMFVIGSVNVTTDASTEFKDLSCAGVVNGVMVEARGTSTGTNTLAATEVRKR
jgi:hypothetical protein